MRQIQAENGIKPMARPQPLQCPFCDNYLRRPVDLDLKSLEVTGGICKCGAIYALDRTGHNFGEIFWDALTFVCRGDIDKALSLNHEDYESMDIDYDLHSNTTSRTGQAGKLVFVRLSND